MRKISLLSLTAFVAGRFHRTKAVIFSLTTLFLLSLSFSGFATVIITAATGGLNICPNLAADGSAPAFTTLTGISLTEGLSSDFSLGTDQIILNAPAGWQFNTGSVPALSFAFGDITGATISAFTTTSITIDITCSGTSFHDTLSINGVQVQATTTGSSASYIYSTETIGILGVTTGVTGTDFGNLSLTAADPTSVTITVAPAGPVCIGTGITFTPTPVNGGITPAYQWFVNGIMLGTGNTYASSILLNGDLVYCLMTSSAACVLPATAMSNVDTANIVSLPLIQTVSGGGSYCAGGSGVDLLLSGSEIGVNYQVYLGPSPVGAPFAGTGFPMDIGPFTFAGTYTVVAITASAGCLSTMSGSATISTIPGPTVFSVTGGGGYCSGGTGTSIGLAASGLGISYQLYLGGTTLVGPAVIGTGFAINFGPQTVAGVYTVTATDLTTGCTVNMAGTANVSINPLPGVFTVTGGGAFCFGGGGVDIGLSGSEIGVNYQLYNDGAIVSSPMTGTGGALDFGFQPIGTYTIIATNASTFCTSNMTGSATITTNPLPTPFTVTGGGGYCIGGTGSDIGLNGSEAGVNYQLFNGPATVGPVVPGTGLSLDFGSQTAAGTYTVVATNAVTSCTVNMTSSATVVINPLPAVFTVTGGGIICANTTENNIALSGSEAGVNYQLFNGPTAVGSPVAGTGSAITFAPVSGAGTFIVTATNGTTGCTNAMTGSATITLNPVPTQYAVTGGGQYCAGDTGVHIGLAGSDAGANYQLINGTTPVGGAMAGTGAALDFGLQTTAGSYIVVASNAITLCTDTMTGSAVVIVNALPNIFNVTGGGNYCVGGTGEDVGLDGSESLVNYQLFLEGVATGIPMGGSGAAIDFGLQTGVGGYTVIATNSVTGCTSTMNDSAVVDTITLPTAYTMTGGGSYCLDGAGVDVGLSLSDAGFNYELFNTYVTTGIVMPGTGAALDFGFQTAAGFYTIVATSTSTTCTANMADGVAVTILPLPDLFDVSGGGTFCQGSGGADVLLSGSVTGINYELFTAGDSITTVAGTGGILDFGLDTLAGLYTVLAVNATTTCSVDMTGDAIITVNPLPNIFFVTGGGFYCAGGAGVDIGLTGSDLAVNYQLFDGATPIGLPVAGTGSGLDFGFQPAAGTYTVVATNPATTCFVTMSGSAVVTINPAPTQYTVTGGGAVCVGGSGVDVGLSGSDVGINYQLYIAGVATGAVMPGTGSAIDFGFQTTSGFTVVVATNTGTSCTDSMANIVYVYIAPIPTIYTISSGGTYCEGGTGIDITLSGSDTGVAYQLYLLGTPVGSPVAGTGSGTLDFGFQLASGSYTISGTNTAAGCASAMTGTATVIMNPAPAAFLVEGGALFCTTVTGSDVSLSGSNTGFSYQLYNGATLVGGASPGTGSSIDFGIQMAVGIYKVISTDGTTGCTATMTDSAIIAIVGYPVVDTIVGPKTICQYSSVSFTDDSAGGAWSSSLPPIATIDAASGIASGVAAGVTTISYTITNAGGCATTVTQIDSVLPAPFIAGISGFTNVCTGLTVTLADPTPGGTWSSSNTTIAVVSGTGVVTGISVGSVTISYTVPGSGVCSSTATDAVIVGSSIAASILSPPGPVTLCNGVPVNLIVSTVGGGVGLGYQWYDDGVPIIGADSMTFTATTPGTYTVGVNNSTCTDVLPTITVLPQPNPVITLDTLANLLLAGPFTRWQWFLNGAPIPGATGNHTPDGGNPGDSYTVVVWDINNCGDTSAAFIVPGASGVNNIIYSGKNIHIYPSPVTSVLHIDAPMKVFVTILSLDGKTLLEQKEAISINVGQLADGMYIIKVYDENNILLKTDKFVKME